MGAEVIVSNAACVVIVTHGTSFDIERVNRLVSECSMTAPVVNIIETYEYNSAECKIKALPEPEAMIEECNAPLESVEQETARFLGGVIRWCEDPYHIARVPRLCWWKIEKTEIVNGRCVPSIPRPYARNSDFNRGRHWDRKLR